MELIGIKDIARHLGLSEATALEMIQLQGMPAEVNEQSVWVSTTEDIEGWQNREAGKEKKGETSLGEKPEVKLAKAAVAKKTIGKPAKTWKKSQAAKDEKDGEDEDIA